MRLRPLDAATTIEDLRLPPSNHLELLRGDRAGQHSIRINAQWRVCFRFAGSETSPPLQRGEQVSWLTLGLVGHNSAVLERARVIRRPAQ